MKKKPRKPRTLFWFGTKLFINDSGLFFHTCTLHPSITRLSLPAAKRLWKWLKQATEYLESRENE